MILAKQTAADKLIPSPDEIARQIGVDLASEPELMHVVWAMRNTPLPPTWTMVYTRNMLTDTTADRNSRSADNESNVSTNTAAMTLEYVNCLTRERTRQHPGASYFLGIVESERKIKQRHGRGEVVAVAGRSQPKNNTNMSNSSAKSIEWSFLSPTSYQQGHGRSGGGWVGASSTSPNEDDTIYTKNDEEAVSTTGGMDSASDATVVRMEKPQAGWDGTMIPNPAEEENETRGIPASRERAPSSRGKSGKRRMPPPKWLVFTSWWNETISGAENITKRKHASIRYATANGSLEVELEGVPAIFEVSHATGRHGKAGMVDIRVGAQLSILGRQMRLMQCDGLTAQWLESEVRAIGTAKARLVSALENGGDTVRVRCRSDRLEVAAAAQRGSGSIGQAAEMDRRALMRDVETLRDILAQTRPEEARRLTEGLVSV